MKFKRFLLIGVFVFYISNISFALDANVLGGYRSSGLAVGLTFEQAITDGIRILGGAVGSTGSPQGIYLLGVKNKAGKLANTYPAWITFYLIPEVIPSAGVVTNGAGVSLVTNNIFSNEAAFLETGIDVTFGGLGNATSAVRLQVMLGYKFPF